MNLQHARPIPSESVVRPAEKHPVSNQYSTAKNPSSPNWERYMGEVDPRRENVHQHEDECKCEHTGEELFSLLMFPKGAVRGFCFYPETEAQSKVEGPECTKGNSEGDFICWMHRTLYLC